MSEQKRILVVNDEPAMVEQITRWLKLGGFIVESAYTGEDGVKLFHEKPFDLVLLDFHLKKEKDGSKTARSFIPRFKEAHPLIPIVIISATEKNITKEELGVEDVYLVESTLWKNFQSLVEKALNN